MRSTKTKAVELAFYRLKEVAYSWFELWEEFREEGSPLVKWGEFADAFIDHFLPAETKAAYAAEFENLKQGSLSVWDYLMRFTYLSKYAIYMLPTMEDRTNKLKNRIEREGSNKARSTGNFGGFSGGGRSTFKGGLSGPSQFFAQSSASAPPAGPSQQQ
ncbi:uncharacterized protein [Nicotiana tomentosiformis]|uniref:uncharacterized protein n=1 Tax=Nicotiana tomentosiformis TaxID=4098 RepID=UPI00388CA7FD